MRWDEAAKRTMPLAGGVGLALIGRAAVLRTQEADLRGQVALVTGGSRGLGLALAHELAAEGCRVVICARDAAELELARTELAGGGAEVLAIPCDVGDRTAVTQLVDQATRSFGGIDLLVNNAGEIQVGSLTSTEVEDFERAMDVMFWGTLFPTLAVLPGMRQRRHGRIINITSLGGKISVPHLLPYNSAKFAAVGLSEGLRAELAGTGVTVTTVVPSILRTGSYLAALFSGDERGQEGEYRWFALGSSLPWMMPADRAAHRIIQAAKQGRAEYIFPISAALATRLQGVAPAATTHLLSLVNRIVLPAPSTSTATATGYQIEQRIESPRWRALTTFGRSAARRFQRVGLDGNGAAG